MGARSVLYAAIAAPIGFVVGGAIGLFIDMMAGSYNPYYLGGIGGGFFEVVLGLGTAGAAGNIGWAAGKHADAQAAVREREREIAYNRATSRQQPAYPYPQVRQQQPVQNYQPQYQYQPPANQSFQQESREDWLGRLNPPSP